MPLISLIVIVLAFVELAVLWLVAGVIGWPAAIFVLVAISVVGVVIVRREGVAASRRLSEAMRSGVVPEDEAVGAALIAVGGVLVFVPGYVTGLAGFCLLIPPIRAFLGRGVKRYMHRRLNRPTYRTVRATATVIRHGPETGVSDAIPLPPPPATDVAGETPTDPGRPAAGDIDDLWRRFESGDDGR